MPDSQHPGEAGHPATAEGSTDSTPAKRRGGRFLRLMALLLVVGLVVGLWALYHARPDLIDGLDRFGYAGAFVLSVVLNATLILPAGNFLVLAGLGATLPSPTLVGLVGGLGAAIGESTGYIAGRSGRSRAGGTAGHGRIEGWFRRFGFWGLLVLSALPLYFDFVGILAGALRYPYWKFFAACLIGRTVLYLAIAWGGATFIGPAI
jgi:membrane protein YqaA with SNARE-associated domain